MTRTRTILSCLLAALTLASCSSKGYAYLYEDLPFEMPQVERPSIPVRSVDIRNFGGVGDGVTLNSEAFAKAIGQACAITVDADRVAFINCRFVANQDTIYTYGKGQRQYFRNCWIEGTTDFIFGASTCWFEDCTILSKRDSYITAASTPENEEFGYVFKNCRLIHNENATKVYLGRPWRSFAKTVFIDCELGDHIRPEGWHNWNKPYAEKTTFYAEYGSKGPGAEDTRVKWSHVLKAKDLKKYTPANVLKCGSEQDKNGVNVPTEWYFKVF